MLDMKLLLKILVTAFHSQKIPSFKYSQSTTHTA